LEPALRVFSAKAPGEVTGRRGSPREARACVVAGLSPVVRVFTELSKREADLSARGDVVVSAKLT